MKYTTSTTFTNKLKAIREELILTIISFASDIGKEISFHSGIVYNYVDDQFSETISGLINENGWAAVIDDWHDGKMESFDELTNEQLLTVLSFLEKGSYNIIEGNEEK